MHGICSRKTDILPDPVTKKLTLSPRTERISFTFRKLKEDGPCKCPYPMMCDSQPFKRANRQEPSEPLKKSFTAAEIENEHVLKVYENIAEHFSDTRHKPWPKVVEFIKSLPVGAVMLDVGCGNGKYLANGCNIVQVGCDTSTSLLGICAERKYEAALSNCLNLPFRSNVFDAVICIAVIHHLASQDRRLKAIEEIVRMLRTGGRALVYVWALEQKREKMSAYLKQRRSNRSKLKSMSGCSVLPKDGDAGSLTIGQMQSSTSETNFNLADYSENSQLPSFKKDQQEFELPLLVNNKSDDDNEAKSLLIHQNRTEFLEQDMFVPWKIKPNKFQNKGNTDSSVKGSSVTTPTFHRFYHVFKEGELESMFVKFPNVRTIKSYYDEGNWCIIIEKYNSEIAELSSGNCNSCTFPRKTDAECESPDNCDNKILSEESEAKLMSLHEVQSKAEHLAKFVISVTSGSQDIEPADEIEMALLRCTSAMVSQHQITFKELVDKLNINHETAYASFMTVANELFEGDKTVVTWGRIVALYAFGSQLALYCNDNHLVKLRETVCIFTGSFARDVISHFVLSEGGWKKLCEAYPLDEDLDSKFWKIFAWSTVGLSLATAVAFCISH